MKEVDRIGLAAVTLWAVVVLSLALSDVVAYSPAGSTERIRSAEERAKRAEAKVKELTKGLDEQAKERVKAIGEREVCREQLQKCQKECRGIE